MAKIPQLRVKGKFASYADMTQDKTGRWHLPNGRFASAADIENRSRWLNQQRKSKRTGRYVAGRTYDKIINRSRARRGKPLLHEPAKYTLELGYKLDLMEDFFEFLEQLELANIRKNVEWLISKRAKISFSAYLYVVRPNEANDEQVDYTLEIMQRNGWTVEKLSMDQVYEARARYKRNEPDAKFYPKLSEDGMPTDHYLLTIALTPKDLNNVYTAIYQPTPMFLHAEIIWVKAEYVD